MSKDTNILAHTTWNCKYHIVFAPKYRRQVILWENQKGHWRNTTYSMREKRC